MSSLSLTCRQCKTNKAAKCPKFLAKIPIVGNGIDKQGKKGWVDVEDNIGPAGDSEKDNINESASANTGLERSGIKKLNGTMSFGRLCCYWVVKKIIYLLSGVLLVSYSSKSPRRLGSAKFNTVLNVSLHEK